MIFTRLKTLTLKWHPAELGVLVWLSVIAFCVCSFAFIVDDVFEDGRHAFDEAVLRALRHSDNLSQPIGPAWLHIALKDITSLGSTAVLALITFASFIYLLMDKKRGAAFFLLVAIGGGTLLNYGLKLLFRRPRPELVPHLTDFYSYSFPSGHAIMSAIVYLTLGAVLCRAIQDRTIKIYILGVAVTMTLLIGFSRVYLGVHWPTDVLAGWCVGASWAILCDLTAFWLQRRHNKI
jgi:undecaprenyl-diphosphatase